MSTGIRNSYLFLFDKHDIYFWQDKHDIYVIFTFAWISAKRVLVDIKIFTNIWKYQSVKQFFYTKKCIIKK